MKKLLATKAARIVIGILIPVLVFGATVAIVTTVQAKKEAAKAQSSQENSETSAYVIVDSENTEETVEASKPEESSDKTADKNDSGKSNESSKEESKKEESSRENSEESSEENSDESSEESTDESSDENSEQTSEETSSENSDEDENEGDSDESSENSEESEGPDLSGLTTYLVRVNCATNVVTIFTYDENGEYTIPVKAMICSTGPATPQGTFIMGYQARWNGLIEDQWGQYVSHITGDFLFHTVPSSTQSESTVQVADYNVLGTSASHGCVRLTAGDCYWMYCNCTAYETIIEIGYYDSDPLGKPAAIKLPTDTATNWDPTDPSADNPWNDKTPYFEGVPESITVQAGAALDLTSGITAYDTCGNVMDYISVDSDIDTNVPGTYTVTYYIEDVLGRSATAETTVTVLAAEESQPAEETSSAPEAENSSDSNAQ